MQFAVIKTGGKQYKVSPGQKIKIEKLDAPEKGGVVFDEVLLVGDDKETKIGQPFIKGAKVEGKILEQGRNKKIIVYKYKSKKRYQVKRGHRQPFTMVEIKKIVV
ncbi:MAG: 50S ribosomal protein L21 [Candidatus Portnoybacteria bacterium]|nr:50S ribosomal protein L21 [Candidatus Portnoybacteria bacterium]